jgi:hypothetical protein
MCITTPALPTVRPVHPTAAVRPRAVHSPFSCRRSAPTTTKKEHPRRMLSPFVIRPNALGFRLGHLHMLNPSAQKPGFDLVVILPVKRTHFNAE